MKLSVIVPIYNVEKYLDRCLNSFQHNKYKDIFEVIMVDDGSPDNSGKIADKFANLYQNYYSFHKKNGGLSDARNYGLEKATGEFIWFVDSDDYITDGAIDEFYRLCESITADVYCFDIEKRTTSGSTHISYKNYDGLKNGHDFLLYQYKNKSFRPEAWRNIYRRSLLLDNSSYFSQGILHEDDEWTPRALINANKIYCSTFTSYIYVVRDNSIMNQKKYDKHIESLKYMIDKYENNDYKFGANLKKMVLDRMINNYISCFAKGQFYNEKKYCLPYSFFKGKSYFLRTKIKVALFVVNKKLFCKISNFLSTNKRMVL